MCQRVTCKSCGKATYRGCGMHVEQVLGDVPKAQRCTCAEQPSPRATTPGAGLLARLRRR